MSNIDDIQELETQGLDTSAKEDDFNNCCSKYLGTNKEN